MEIQEAHGERQLLIWQARAAWADRAGVRQISPAYYAACAAQAAFETYRLPRYERAPAPASEPPIAHAPASPAPTLVLNPACDALLVEMGIRERELLATVPLAAIQQWAAVLDHPGLAARFDDVRGFAHTQLRRGNAPPSLVEMDRWASRARARAAPAPGVPLAPADEERIAAREAEIQARAAALAPSDLTEEERLALLADLEAGLDDAEVRARLLTRRDVMSTTDTSTDKQQILADLRLVLPRRHWSLLERVTLEGDAGNLRLVCSVADRGLVEAHLLPVFQAQPVESVRVVTRGATGQVAPTTVATPPDWIALDQWAALPPLMRTALVGSTLDADGTLHCASSALRALLDARYTPELAALLRIGNDRRSSVVGANAKISAMGAAPGGRDHTTIEYRCGWSCDRDENAALTILYQFALGIRTGRTRTCGSYTTTELRSSFEQFACTLRWCQHVDTRFVKHQFS